MSKKKKRVGKKIAQKNKTKKWTKQRLEFLKSFIRFIEFVSILIKLYESINKIVGF